MQSKYQLNYSASYHYALGLLQKLYQTIEQSLEKDAFKIHDYIRKWGNLLKEYKELGKCAVQWEVFAESLLKMPDSFLQKELIDYELDISTHNEIMEEEDYNGSQVQTTTFNNYAMSIFERVTEQFLEILSSQLSQLKSTLQESQSAERRLSQQKKQTEQMIELQRQQNEELRTLKHDFELKIENLKRELSSR